MASCFICDRSALAARGQNPTLIMEMPSGFAVLGDNQFLPGYSLLLARDHVQELHDLTEAGRDAFLRDMATLGEAVWRATRPLKMNYAMLGNAVPHLHAHVHARYATEPVAYRRGPISGYPTEMSDDPKYQFDPARDAPLIDSIRRELRLLRAR